MNRKCLFNSQLKVKGMFTRRSCLRTQSRKQDSFREVEMEKRMRYTRTKV